MIVEFIGCTGSGKTTLIKEVEQELAKTARVNTSIEFVTGLLGLQRVANPTAQNLIQEIVGFPFFLRTWNRYRTFIRYTTNLFLRNSSFSIKTINNLRSLERKIGVYEITKSFGKNHVILVDEGPILAAHMFAFTGSTYTPEEITRFTELLPLPDMVVYVRASVDTIVERTMRRPDPPREIESKEPTLIEQYAKKAVALFDQLTQAENIRCRLVVIESPDVAEPGYKQIVHQIAQSIQAHSA